VGKEQDITSHAASPAPELVDLEIADSSAVAGTGTLMHLSAIGGESGEIHETVNREDDRTSTDDLLSMSLNRIGSRSQGGDDDDIEMGELAEDPRNKGKRKREDLEEGEASDSSSALSDPPED
jgi:THO complex subunit 7